ncbi:DUF397 domain-containing protein [Actinacidiphila yeochonensis]|uniref:DUF397 domain-containing protein n=1 Tax=Actinacidiphila yeochonensis TaxID=89050 RepID=UPI000559D86C|nr:DUF397 domain-containing protein [Actinacidiphila yeochonensis]
MTARHISDASVVFTAWRKSSYSGGDNGDCVEVADLPGVTAVRDSKDPCGPALLFGAGAWAEFVGAVKAGRFPA